MCFSCSVLSIFGAKGWGECFIFSIALFIWITEIWAPCLKLLETMDSQISVFLFVLFTLRPSVRCSQVAQCLAWEKVVVYIYHGTVPEAIASLKWVCQNLLTDGPIVFCKSRESSHDLCSSLLLSQGCLKRQLVLQWGTKGRRGDRLQR